ncbi:MAG: hypothetical protein ACLP01_33220 [Solirubrobacteraceae bacterium]
MFRQGGRIHGMVFDSIQYAELRERLATPLMNTPPTRLDDALRRADLGQGKCIFVPDSATATPVRLGSEPPDWPSIRRFSSSLDRTKSGAPIYGFARAREEINDPEDLVEVNQLETEVERAWERTVALNCNCSYGYEVQPSEAHSRFGRLLVGAMADRELADDFVRRLGNLKIDGFRRFTSEHREQLERWGTAGDSRAYHRTMSDLTKVLAKESGAASDGKSGSLTCSSLCKCHSS